MVNFSELSARERVVIYRRFAAEAAEMARSVPPRDAGLYVEIARQWLHLAELTESWLKYKP